MSSSSPALPCPVMPYACDNQGIKYWHTTVIIAAPDWTLLSVFMCTGWIDRVMGVVINSGSGGQVTAPWDTDFIDSVVRLVNDVILIPRWVSNLEIHGGQRSCSFIIPSLVYPLLSFVLNSIDEWRIYDENDDSNNLWSSFRSSHNFWPSVFWFPPRDSFQVAMRRSFHSEVE